MQTEETTMDKKVSRTIRRIFRDLIHFNGSDEKLGGLPLGRIRNMGLFKAEIMIKLRDDGATDFFNIATSSEFQKEMTLDQFVEQFEEIINRGNSATQ